MEGGKIPIINRLKHQRIRFAGQILYKEEGFMVVEGFGGGKSGYLIPTNGNKNFEKTSEGYVFNPVAFAKERQTLDLIPR